MTKWSGKSGGLILVNELKKNSIADVNHMNESDKVNLLNSLTMDYLRTFLGRSRFVVARSELISVLEISPDDYRINDMGYSSPKSPNLFSKQEIR